MAGENPALTINGDITMDEDIRFQLSVLCVDAAGATTRYWVCPYKCTFRDLIAVVGNADPGDGATVTVVNHTDTITLGVATFGSGLAVGDKATWVADTGDGEDYVCAEGDVLSFAVVADTATDIVEITFELDPKCRAV